MNTTENTSDISGISLNGKLPVVSTPLPPRFLVKFVTDAVTGCWNWIGSKRYRRYKDTFYYYGTFCGGYAHRFSYVRHRGEIPEGFELDHTCQNKLCVNPKHLEAVTHRENCRRRKKSGPYPDPNSIRSRRGFYAGRYQ